MKDYKLRDLRASHTPIAPQNLPAQIRRAPAVAALRRLLPRTLTEAHTSRRISAHLRMFPHGGKANDKQADQYTGTQPGEGSVVTSRNTATAEGDVRASGHTHRKSMRRAGEKGEPEKGKSLAPYSFDAALVDVPSEDCLPACLPANRTIMLRMASKRVREVVDKARLPAVVRLSRTFWDDARNGTAAEKLKLVMRRLVVLTALSASPHSS